MRKTLARTTAATAIALGALTAGAGMASAGTIDVPEVPADPTGVDYVNTWNESGAHLGAGAAGLVSSAWAGAIPSILGA
ncbi:hypothetical protein [Prauserella rugosa]|uniref:Secreted protein n=1 Tax=Prauserella rugosa TaxID=43354 RepID=A0A660CGC2_9PSEU|nr:hypothetical protein [Prauserella rugosa]KMS90066.1 hypothetical protein ACZ91_17135 [Streptomyces regensis]TWH22396.1 hypothetical protein JD82_04277 [Prauserella rugosa]